MTDEQVIKALEYCKEQGITSECSECNIKEKVCRREMVAIALDLIKRQQAEIEALINGQETLQKMCAEAYKYFAERLKNKILDMRFLAEAEYQCEEIDNLVKELTEGRNG